MRKIGILLIPLLFYVACIQNPNQDPPYFVNTPDANDATAFVGYNVLLDRKFIFSWVTVTTIDSTKIDSSFSCSGSTCQWHFVMKYDTAGQANITSSQVDSQRSFQRIKYSFFQSKNDSFAVQVYLIDGKSGKRIYPDSVWGDLYARPSSDLVISFTFHGDYDYSSLKTVLTLVQVDNSVNTVSLTIADEWNLKSLGDSVKVVSDSLCNLKRRGKWKLVINGTSVVYQNTGIIINNDSLYQYNEDSIAGSPYYLPPSSAWAWSYYEPGYYIGYTHRFYLSRNEILHETVTPSYALIPSPPVTKYYVLDTSYHIP